ncbi:class A beta-lactamase, subclass A2 [Mucilaginibacter sp. BJC16-A38]|uniref:class A beta-lactamase, subclass A2 n=1 Tax=Mucilaginibacter phenanthrenivorans TaxID=1234842 RepID=UPI0021587468|nr:class A beta-lactamase, subclass A2 [Mucilaginibacter phenanthrenivorans]MCR8559490.1 class A beta-lactamase, subclass A2 [Mucilaginibacter phenanthrenivorans]
MKKFLLSAGLMLILLPPFFVKAQTALREQITTIAKSSKGIVGVSILGLESRDTLSVSGDARLVMHSVMKFPIALTVLHWVDSGKLTLDKKIHIKKKDLPKTYSPLRDKYPDGNVDVSIADLLSYMVSLSDNDACDILLKVIDGPKTVQDYMLHIGIRGIAVRASEADMASSWELQYTNWCKPKEATILLDKFYKGEILSKPNTDFLYKILSETSTGPHRIKGLLPAGTVVAHKTGTSPTNDSGLSPATNDVGIITLPNGKHLAISIFVCNSTDDEATRDAVIAKIAKAAYDHYCK